MKLGKSLQTCCANFSFALADILSEKNLFLESTFINLVPRALFPDQSHKNAPWGRGCNFIAIQELITRTLSFANKTSRLVRISVLISNLNKEFFFFSRKLFHKTNRKLFSCAANPSSVYIRLNTGKKCSTA